MSSSPRISGQPRLQPDDRLREYRIVRLVGMGGMGAVYEAEHTVLNAKVAIKEILFHPDAVEAREYERLEEAFLKEARLLMQLDARKMPSSGAMIPRAHNLFQEGKSWYLVMEYIEGITLAEMWEQNNKQPLPVAQVQKWLLQLLTTLDYLHQQQPPLIHRDIKPANLKINDEGRLVLLDFGIAKGGMSGGATTAINSTVTFYSPYYSPPEQMRGMAADARSDLFSTAATFYTLLAGTQPPTVEVRSFAKVEGDPDPVQRLDRVNATVPPLLAQVIEVGLALRMDERPANASEMRGMVMGEVPLPERLVSTPVNTWVEDESYDDVDDDPDSDPVSEAVNGVWGAPVMDYEKIPVPPPPSRAAIPWGYIGAGVVGVILVLLIGMQLFQSSDNPTASDQAMNPTAESIAAATEVEASPEEVVSADTAGQALAPAEETALPTNTPRPIATTANGGNAIATSTRLVQTTPTSAATATPSSTAILSPTATGAAVATVRPTNTIAPAIVQPTVAVLPTVPVRGVVLVTGPNNGESFAQSSSILLGWQAQPLESGESYYVRIWKQSVPNVAERELNTTSNTAVIGGMNPESYQWTVQIQGSSGLVGGTQSAVRSFTVTGVPDSTPNPEPEPTQPQPEATMPPVPTDPPLPEPQPTDPPLPTRSN